MGRSVTAWQSWGVWFLPGRAAPRVTQLCTFRGSYNFPGLIDHSSRDNPWPRPGSVWQEKCLWIWSPKPGWYPWPKEGILSSDQTVAISSIIHPSIHPSILLSILLYTHLSMCLCIHASIHPLVHSFSKYLLLLVHNRTRMRGWKNNEHDRYAPGFVENSMWQGHKMQLEK